MARSWKAKTDPGPVAWWDWRDGWRPRGWTDGDEAHWRGDTDSFQLAPRRSESAPVDEAERIRTRRLWAALMLTLDLAICCSLLLGRKVLAARLNPEVLRRALRGAALPDPDSYLPISVEMLDAVAEAGPLMPSERKWP